MNSVFSAFKTNKGDKQKLSIIGSKKICNPQDSSYENLRHIREIASSTKMMTSIVNDDVEEDLHNLRKRPIIKTTMLDENDCYPTSVDVVDHHVPSQTKTLTTSSSATNLVSNCSNMDVSRLQLDAIKPPEQFCMAPMPAPVNGLVNGFNSDRDAQQQTPATSSLATSTCDSLLSPKQITDSTSNSSSSSSASCESNNLPPPPNSPTISRCSSSCSNSSSTSCEITTIAATSVDSGNPDHQSSISSSSSSSTTSSSLSTVTPSSSLTMLSSTSSLGSASNFVNPTVGGGATTTTNAMSPMLMITAGGDNHTQPIIMGSNRASSGENLNSNDRDATTTTSSSSATTTPKSARYSKPRLSLSGFTNNSMPSVHGRSATGTTSATNGGGQPKTRLSTHQRNLSLDFRSMGILLPPVSQVTNTRINLTQHHRNRSLDSALQRIPEVEVSSPNAETDNTFCTNSILGSTMCSKIVTSSSTNPQNTPKASATNSAIIEPCTRPNSTANVLTDNTTGTAKVSESKKREDLTSLGSDDSGIICGSESDQVSLNRIRQSHESLDSGEIDPEEECIEILETTSMDEEYRMLQSDLCFYQTPEKDLRAIKNRRKADEQQMDVDEEMSSENANGDSQSGRIILENNRICVPIDIEDVGKIENSVDDLDATPTPSEEKSVESSVKASAPAKAETIEAKPAENIKNEILFKNFFGATKNAIFRTAQSIIENHEKKNSAKNKSDTDSDVKSPTEISKKKEFFVLKSSSSKNKVGATATTPDPAPTVTELETKTLTKSASGTSLNKLRVPGMVKCFVKEKDQSQQQQMKVEKGPSGLLRFFESPVFNIHFAVHYLFYSKEPGVLSFIGNKVFSFPDQEVDLYIPQLIVMYIQMDELAEVLDPYLTYRSRRSVDFSLKCQWLLEAYNYQVEPLSGKKTHLSLMKELYSKKERKHLKTHESEVLSPIKKTHHRSQSDATGLLNDSRRFPSSGALTLNAKIYPPTPAKLCLGDLTSGKAFENGCTCFESVRGTVNDLLGHKTVCRCGAPKMAPQKEFMKALINIGKNLTSLQTKAEKTSALRMFLNLINKNLPARVWLPLHSDIPHHIVRITEEKTAVLNSKDKTPYIIYVEVVEVNDIYSSPVIMKLMPSLRHTKSEEHLDSKEKNDSNSNSSSNLSKDSGADCTASSKDSKASESSSASEPGNRIDLNEINFTEDDVWSQEEDEITAQYLKLHKMCDRDAISQMSLDSCDSRDQNVPVMFNIGDVRTRHCINLYCENTKPFSNDPEDPSAAALKEPWHEKEKQIRESSPYGHLSNWRLLSAIVKCGDDLRQELMATQLLEMFKIIWLEENVDLWVRPYKIVCLSNDSGLIEPILNTVSLHQIKKNSNKSLRDYFIDEYGDAESAKFKAAQKNFMQSCAAYCLVSYLLQVKDRHNGNILLHSDGHLIHIDFGFILSISPKNLGFEQSPFKLTPEFVDVMGGTSSELWTEFNHLLLKGLMAARKHMDRIINLVEIMRSNAQLPCFKNGCSGTVQNLRKRFHMNLTEQELERKVEQLVQDSLKSLSTKLYDGYQYYTNGIL